MAIGTIGALIGGLGLFIFGISMISEGLRLAAGERLRDMLGKWTKTPARGVATGVLMTGIVQSSSAVTVATIGFVNAGLVTLYQALGVIYGANVGTTMTGWLVSVVGFNIKIEAFALPIIGVGAVLRLVARNERSGSFGLALAGFGLFFLGIDVLRDAFQETAVNFDFSAWRADGIRSVLFLVGIGFLVTALTQSSSAALALILTAVAGGLLPLAGAAAMVIGANVGTTTTALFAVIGATPNAKRVAAAHVFFNLVTGAVALLLLPGLLWLISALEQGLSDGATPTFSIAAFHTVFNLLGVILLWPLTRQLTECLSIRFQTEEEEARRPRYLDSTVAAIPALSVSALFSELTRVGMRDGRMFARTLDLSQKVSPDSTERDTVHALTQAIADFVTRVQRVEMPEDISRTLTEVVHAASHYASAASLIVDLARLRHSVDRLRVGPERDAVLELFEIAAAAAAGEIEPVGALDVVKDRYSNARNTVLQGAIQGRLDIAHLEATLEALRCVRRATEQLIKAAIQMQLIGGAATASSPLPEAVSRTSV